MENSTAVRLVISFLHPDKFVVRRPLIKPLYTPPENVSKPLVFDVFKEYRNEALARNELMLIKHISHLAASRSLFIYCRRSLDVNPSRPVHFGKLH